VVVVTRADGAIALESQKSIGWAETIEAHLRSECLSYGAAILFTRVQGKNNRNIDVLYEYLMHRIYAYPLKRRPQVPSRDSLFLPSGWDSHEKVDRLAVTLDGGLARSFASTIVSPNSTPDAASPDDEYEDMHAFLQRSANKLGVLGRSTGPTATLGQTTRTPITTPSATLGHGTVTSGSTLGNGGTGSAVDVPAPGGFGTDNTGTDKTSAVACFFRDLLNRGQTGAQASRPRQATAKPGTNLKASEAEKVKRLSQVTG